MRKENYLSFGEADLKRPIYRYIKMDALYELLESRHNKLSHPSIWDDPFENLTLNGQGRYPDGTIREFGLRENVYGQCWTQEMRSDAMWRIYCPTDKDGNICGVRIRTTPRRLANSLSRAVGKNATECTFIGKVDYWSDHNLEAVARSLFATGVSPVAVAKSLLIKRKAFTHEKEVRIIYRNLSEETIEGGSFQYPVDPEKLITQIMVPPCRSVANAMKIKAEIKARTAGRIKVKRSLLYKEPGGLIFDVPW
jgi:hypothetical protein